MAPPSIGGQGGANLPSLPPPPARLHFVGIGGISMSGLASVLHERGYQVSGSDITSSGQTAMLAARGVPVAVNRDGDPERAARAALLITTRAALRCESAEIRAAHAAGVPFVKRGDLLGLIANERCAVAVAGSAGKSTTTGMVTMALRELGADPSYAVGGILAGTGTNAALGDGDTMVVEADEFDYAFLALRPEIAVITNVEYDHPDIFPDQAAYDAAFAGFASQVRPGGALVLAADDPGCARIQSHADFVAPAKVVTFGQVEEADWRLTCDREGWLVIGPDRHKQRLPVIVPGVHNARNATAALAALVALGYDSAASARAVGAFTGIARRFEVKGDVNGVTVVDDYAHHPTKVRATLRAAREAYRGRRLWAVFQPHTYSRTRALLGDFGAAFGDADRIMILDIYAARETDTLGVGADDLLALLPSDAIRAGRPLAAAERLASLVEPGDVVLTMGAGDITDCGPYLLALLATRHRASVVPGAS